MPPEQGNDALVVLPSRIITARWVLHGYFIIASVGLALHVGINQALGQPINCFLMALMAIITAASALSLFLLHRSLVWAMRLNTWAGMLCVWGMVMNYLHTYPDENLVAIILMLHASIFALSLILGFKAALEYAVLASFLLLIMGFVHPQRVSEAIALSFVAFGVTLPSKLVERLIEESTAEITRANTRLGQEVVARRQAEEELQRHRDHLEDMVNARTAELDQANQKLHEEIAERQQAEATLQQRTAQLEAIRQTSLDVTAELDLDALLSSISHQAVKLVDADAGGLYLYRPEQDVLEWYVSIGPHMLPTGTLLRRGEGLSGKVLETGQPLIVDDYQHWEGQSPAYNTYPLAATISVPICWRDEFLGVLNVSSQSPAVFSAADAELLGMFAVHAAIALVNARLVKILRQQAAELQARNEELDAFAQTVAHDLKNPLGPILGVAQVLENEYPHLPDQEMRHGIHMIVQNSARMNNIIDALLLLADVRQMKAAEIMTLDMASITAEALRRLADMIEQAQAQIITPDTSTWPAVVGHPVWVEEVWVNYLTNALKYGRSPTSAPCVELGFSIADASCESRSSDYGLQIGDPPSTTANPQPAIKFWVRDCGPGIPPEEQARLFTPFTRLHQVQTKGYGLGLSIVRRIVEKLGGQVGVESQPGQGSLFFFNLPPAGE
ncbi:MAG: GAF domain-containing protein [Thermoflexales bacterium]|nr:GAF domain-containing protein [Thermoflexales bacterium]